MNYVVRPGDSLYSIASRFGVSVDELARINRISDPELIYPGQTLFIPMTPGRPSPEDGSVEGRIDNLERRVDRLERRVGRLEDRIRR